MKSIGMFILALGLVCPPHPLHAQTVSVGGFNNVAAPVQIAAPVQPVQGDSIARIIAEAHGLQPVSLDALSFGGTFWTVLPGGDYVPMPCPPSDPSIPIFAITDSQFLVDESGGEAVANPRRPGVAPTTAMIGSRLANQSEALVSLIADIQTKAANQQRRMLARSLGMDDPSPPSPGDGGGDGGGEGSTSTGGTVPTFDHTQLWLEFTNINATPGWTTLNLHHATNQVYAIWSTTNLATPCAAWQVETEVWPTDTNCQPFTVPTLERQNLFLRAEDWTGVDSNGDGVPDWWIWKYFGTLTLSGTNLDNGGVNTLLEDYTNNWVPNVYSFTGIEVANNYVNNMNVPVQLDVAGSPYYIATLVDDNNFSNAVWHTYSGSSLTVNLGLTEGWHDVWIGLRGHADDSNAAMWQWKRLKLDLTPPALVITGPTNGTVSQPVMQLTGYSPEPLVGISYDLTNAAGLTANRQVFVLDQQYDTNHWEFTTNTFQAFDVLLTNGVNTFTLHATDLAGNVTTTNFSFTLDYSSKTNPPLVKLNWPQNGVSICGTSFTCNGWISDPTATVVVQLVGTNGQAIVVNAAVGRDGNFWAENLPLNGGSNLLTLAVTDAVGNTVTNNLTVLPGNIGLGIDSVSAGQATVTGEINPGDYTVWVNGTQATNNGSGAWTAQIAPIGVGGGVVEALAIPNSDNGGNGSGGSLDAAGNPHSAQAQGAQSPIESSQGIYISSYQESDQEDYYEPPYTNSDGYVFPSFAYSDINFTHWTDGKGGDGQWMFHDVPGNPVRWSYSWPATTWPEALPNGTGIETHLAFTNIPPYSIVCSPPTLAKEHCNINYGNSPFMPTNLQRTAETKLKLATGGPAGSAQMNLWVLTVNATAYYLPWTSSGDTWYHWLTSTSVPPQNISLLGQTPGADGKVYVVLPDNTNLDATPIVTGGYNNYTFDVNPQKYRLTIVSAGQDVTDSNSTVFVGQFINPYCDWDGGGGPTITNYSWTVPSITFSDYVANASSGTLYTDFPITNAELACYWVDGGNKKVQCTVGVEGQTLSVQTTFIVNRPTATMTATVTGQIRADSDYTDAGTFLHFGGNWVGTNYIAGIKFQINGTDTNGNYFFVQVGSTYREHLWSDGADYIGVGGPGIDDGADRGNYIYPMDPTQGTNATSDSPSSGLLSTFTRTSASDSFTTYLMFIPTNVGDARPVPLQKVDWNWSATAIQTNAALNLWKVTTNSPPSGLSPANTTTHPQWTTNLLDSIHWSH